jgi:hypothetical protein
MKILFYSQQTSKRLSYIIDFFSTQINAEIIFTTDLVSFKNAEAIKISYSTERISKNALHIQPHGLLFENKITQQNINCFEWQNNKAFFKTNGDIPFDVFAASFYLITRYEEYLPHEKDMYGRYAHTESIAFKENFLQLPLVDIWLNAFAKLLQQQFPAFNFQPSAFSFIPTYDIDIAYAYRGKGFFKNVVSSLRSIASFNTKQLNVQLSVLFNNKKDPFDTFSWLDDLHQQYKLQPIYFFLLANKPKGYDKNIPPHKPSMQQLIKQLTAKYASGIHPSWQSGNNQHSKLLELETEILKQVSQKSITKSRQHYIRLTLPITYRIVIELGIEEEYSMGYGSINGFRASTSKPFYWYDLEKGQQTALCIHPFCYMEANSFFEQHYSASEAAVELQQYHDVVKSVNGQLITIFHNHFITEQPKWVEWRNMYNAFLLNNFNKQY